MRYALIHIPHIGYKSGGYNDRRDHHLRTEQYQDHQSPRRLFRKNILRRKHHIRRIKNNSTQQYTCIYYFRSRPNVISCRHRRPKTKLGIYYLVDRLLCNFLLHEPQRQTHLRRQQNTTNTLTQLKRIVNNLQEYYLTAPPEQVNADLHTFIEHITITKAHKVKIKWR